MFGSTWKLYKNTIEHQKRMAQEMKENPMSEEELTSFVNDLVHKNKHRNNATEFEMTDIDSPAYFNPRTGEVKSPPEKATILHEFGHAFDENLNPRLGLQHLAEQGTSSTMKLGLPAAAIYEANQDEFNPALPLGVAAVGTGLTGAGLYLRSRHEDKANRFVMEHMTEELGSPEKAKEWFDNSSLKPARATYKYDALSRIKRPLLAGGAVTGLGALAHKHIQKRKEEETMNKQANEMQDPREGLAWLGGASLGLGGAAAIGASQNMNEQLRQAVEENTKGLPADVKDAYTKASRKAATQEMLSAPKKALVDGALHSPGKSLAGLVGGGALATLGYQMHKYDELNKQANSLEEEQAELERLEVENREAFNAYGAQPHALGPRVALQAATTGGGYFGGAAAGGLLGEALERKSGTKFFKGVGEPIGRFNGKVMGTIGGTMLGLQGQNIISNHLDKKHPERVELRKQHEEAEDKYYEQLNKVVDMEEGTYKQAYEIEYVGLPDDWEQPMKKLTLTPEQEEEFMNTMSQDTISYQEMDEHIDNYRNQQAKKYLGNLAIGSLAGVGAGSIANLATRGKTPKEVLPLAGVAAGIGLAGLKNRGINKEIESYEKDIKNQYSKASEKRHEEFAKTVDPDVFRIDGVLKDTFDKQANYDDILEKQREIVDMQEALAVRRAQIDALAEEVKATGQAYDAQPHASLTRLGVLGGATGVGAGVGALVSGARGYGATGALPGAVAGGLAGLAAQPFISNHLDKKHPERVEARAAIEGANRALFETKGRYEDEKSLRDLAVEDAAKAGLEHPSLYAKAVREVGDQFPIREVNSQIQKMREARAILEQQEAELKRLAIDEKKAVIRGATSANDLTEEQVIKEKMKNYQRAEKMNLV